MDEAMGDSSTSLPVLSASETDQQQQAVGPPVYCQVLGCGVLLTGGKTYCIKKRACTTHIQAESVSLSEDSTTMHRFCQQCGKFEAIHKFDGTKRSCRARLAKRRSGTRALLQKKGCKDSHHGNSSDQGATAAAAAAAAAAKASSCSQHTDIYPQDEQAGFSAQQQLMMMYSHHQNSNEALLSLLSLPDDTTAADAAPGMQHSSSPGPIGAPARSLSDGTPMASASAAAAAAAANAAAAAAAHQAISAPLYLLPRSGTGTSDAAGMPQKHQAAAAAAGCGGEDGPMGQAEVLKALQALEDPSDPLQRINQRSATSAVHAGALTPPPVTGGYPAAEHTSCSVPLAQLDLGSSGALPKAVPAPGSPMHSAGGAPCKSAPLAGLALGQSLGLGPQQRQTSRAGQQQQQGSMDRAGSRLKWLIQQLQQELDVCNPAELEALNNDELGTLLCAALAPATSNAAAAAGDDAAAAAARGAHARATTVPVKPDPAAASNMASFMPPAHPSFSAGFAPTAMGGSALGTMPCPVSDLDLQLQKAHVQQLQQRVHQLQMQLHVREGSSRPGDMHCATPPLAGNCPDMAAVYRSLSGMPDGQGVRRPSPSMQQQQPLDSLLFGTGGAASMSAPLQTASLMRGQHMPAGSMPAAVAAAASGSRMMDTNAAQWMAHGMGGVSQPLAMPGSFLQVQQAQQRLQQVQQQAMSLQMAAAASAGMQRQPDAAAAMQFMALQNQLRMVEEEMLMLMAQQSAVTR